jgi:hypothetical protein
LTAEDFLACGDGDLRDGDIMDSEGKECAFDKSDYNRDGGVASGSKACAVNRGG